MEGTRSTPGKVEELVYNTAVADGIKVVVCLWQDPGQAGKYDVDRMRRVLTGYPVRVAQAAKNKQEYAETWSPLVEQGRVYVLRGAWNEALFGEAEAFPDGAHDDQIDALSRAFLELTSGGAHRLKHAMDRVRNG
jgi:predicted phage terminase large subunit-like protein